MTMLYYTTGNRRPAMRENLTDRQRALRLKFAKRFQQFPVEFWRRFLYTDESRVRLFASDRRKRVYRRKNERFAACCIQNIHRFGYGSLMVWGGICYDARTELIPVEGILNSERYVQQICEPVIRLFIPCIGRKKFILMQDNARPHSAKMTEEYLQAEGIRWIKWPPMSPDLNPIEHLWDELKRKIKSEPAPQSMAELRIRLQYEWDCLPQEVIQNLIDSMPRRLAAVIRARGGPTKY